MLTIITCGIYNYFFIHSIAKDMNVALEGDGERTSGLGAYILFSILTCGIYSLYWEYKIANRMQKRAMEKYNVVISENGTSVLL